MLHLKVKVDLIFNRSRCYLKSLTEKLGILLKMLIQQSQIVRGKSSGKSHGLCVEHQRMDLVWCVLRNTACDL